MGTWTQLTDELSACERAVTAVRLKTEEKLKLEASKAEGLENKRKEFIAKHEQVQKEIIEEHDIGMSRLTQKAAEEIRDSMEAKGKADRRCAVALERARAAEQKARELERKIKKLYAIWDQRDAAHEALCADIVDASDVKARQCFQDTEREVAETAMLANDIQESTIATVEQLGRVHKIKEPDRESFERSRFKHLLDLVVSHSVQDMTSEEFENAKPKILQEWHADWVGATEKVALPLDDLAKVHTAVNQERNLVAKADRPRVMDVAKQRADEQKFRREETTRRAMTLCGGEPESASRLAVLLNELQPQ